VVQNQLIKPLIDEAIIASKRNEGSDSLSNFLERIREI